MPATPPQHPIRRPTRLFHALCAAALLTLAGCSAAKPEPPLAGSTLGGPFTLVDKTGKTVHYSDFSGKYRIVYFGYTFCPDVCPLDLQHMMLGYHLFAKAHPPLAARVAPMFITVDPARDTPAVMGQYTAPFGNELIGLTGTPAQIATAAKAFAVFYQKRPGETPGTYLMDHSRAAYLMDPDGKPIALLPVDSDGKAVAAELETWVQ
jgi:protein SCO1/2